MLQLLGGQAPVNFHKKCTHFYKYSSNFHEQNLITFRTKTNSISSAVRDNTCQMSSNFGEETLVLCKALVLSFPCYSGTKKIAFLQDCKIEKHKMSSNSEIVNYHTMYSACFILYLYKFQLCVLLYYMYMSCTPNSVSGSHIVHMKPIP